MAWDSFWTLTPLPDWERNLEPLSSRLIRVSYFGDALWLSRFFPKLFLRIYFDDLGHSQRWVTLFPQSGQSEVIVLETIPDFDCLLEVRKSTADRSINANYNIVIEQFISPEWDPQNLVFDGGIY